MRLCNVVCDSDPAAKRLGNARARGRDANHVRGGANPAQLSYAVHRTKPSIVATPERLHGLDLRFGTGIAMHIGCGHCLDRHGIGNDVHTSRPAPA